MMDFVMVLLAGILGGFLGATLGEVVVYIIKRIKNDPDE